MTDYLPLLLLTPEMDTSNVYRTRYGSIFVRYAIEDSFDLQGNPIKTRAKNPIIIDKAQLILQRAAQAQSVIDIDAVFAEIAAIEALQSVPIAPAEDVSIS